MSRAWQRAVGVLLLLGCIGPSSDHEQLGDQHYRAAEYERALAEYQAAVAPSARPRLWGKLGAAALQLGEYTTAAEAYLRLAQADPTRTDEAAVGLARVARGASREGAGDGGSLARAITALRTVAPSRPLGRLALAPARDGALSRQEALAVLPVALAVADGRMVDSLLLRWAIVLHESLACDAAVGVYRTVVRRGRVAGLARAARSGVAECTLMLGLEALVAEHLDEAERWFDEAASTDYAGAVGWRARIGYGDARGRQGDLMGAAAAYQSVLSGQQVPDSLLRLAEERLNAIGGPMPPTNDRPPPMGS
ncbi:MAG: tetratricopeptide repeat protein [Gemmatimonadota bacterium]|nr:tetratricopeptide repeat protein [Gemmatimonadota bacterium]